MTVTWDAKLAGLFRAFTCGKQQYASCNRQNIPDQQLYCMDSVLTANSVHVLQCAIQAATSYLLATALNSTPHLEPPQT